MKRKQLWRVLGTSGLALSLLVSPMTGLSASAAGEDATADGGTESSTKKEGGSVKKINPLQKAQEAVGTEGEVGYKPAVDAYSDTEIPVWGFTQDSIVYSVDVEWGAMTFQYESSTWNPDTHQSAAGAGWRVYDSENEEALDDKEHAINEIKVTNHSNAGVWATLSYAGETGYTDITGTFSGNTNELTAAAGSVPAYLTLDSADNGLGTDGAGKETVGKAYFMPTNPGDGDTKPSNITKWTKIGIITVGIKTEVPTATQPPVGP